MDFDLDEYIKKNEAAAKAPSDDFDLDAYIDKHENGPSFMAKHGGELRAAGDHAANAATLGYLPQVEGGLTHLALKADDMLHGTHNADLVPYSKLRDDTVARLEQEKRENPKSAIAGSVGGAIASGIAAAPLAPARAATALGRIGQAGATAGIMGGLSNPGDHEGEVDPLQLEDRAKHAALAAPLGAAGHGLLEGVGALGGAISDKLGSFAEKRAFKALGPLKRDALNNADNVNDIGRTVLDSGIIRKVPTSAEGLADRAAEAAEGKGKELGNIVDELQSAGEGSGFSGVQRKTIADNLRGELIKDSEIPAVQRRNQYFKGLIEEFEKTGNGADDLAKLRSLKNDVGGEGGLINWKRMYGADVPDEEQFHRALYGQLRGAEDESADAIEKGVYGEASNRFGDAKKAYGNLKTAQQIAEKRAGADMANRTLGLTDTISGGAGAGIGAHIGEVAGTGGKVGAVIGGAVGSIGNKLGRTYGNQVLASGSDSLSRLFQMNPKLAQLASNNPTAMASLTSMVSKPGLQEKDASSDLIEKIKNNPQLLEFIRDPKLKAQINEKLGRGPGSEGVVHPEEAKKQFLEAN